MNRYALVMATEMSRFRIFNHFWDVFQYSKYSTKLSSIVKPNEKVNIFLVLK